MNEFTTSAGLMFPAAFRRGVPGPADLHSTIIFLGNTAEVEFTKDDVLNALPDMYSGVYFWATVTGLAMFGPDHDTPVLLINAPLLNEVQSRTELALAQVGIHSASEFEYNPHVTVDERTFGNPPRDVILKPAQLWWGSERINL